MDGGGPEGGAGICCPIEITASTPCGCWGVGGYAPSLAACRRHCDGTNYSRLTDEHGCPYLAHYGLGSCLPVPDVGSPVEDAGLDEDAGDPGDAGASDDGAVSDDDAGML